MEKMILKENELTIGALNNFSETFIDYLDVDDLTLKAYKVGIKQLIEYLKKNNIKHLNRESIIGFRNYLRENYSSSTVNSYMTSIKALFKYLEMNNKYPNIARDIKGAKYSTTPKKQVLSLEKTKEIYNSLTDLREKCLFSLAITTALRGIEMSRAKIEDIKIHNGEVVLFVQCKKHDEKDEYVKLSQQVLQDIKNYIGNRESGYIFVSTSNNNKGGGVTTTTLRKTIKNIFKRFGLDDDTFSLHSTRRTSATLMYQNGIDIHSIQQVCHHVSSNTTARYINSVTRNDNKSEYIVSNAIFN